MASLSADMVVVNVELEVCTVGQDVTKKGRAEGR